MYFCLIDATKAFDRVRFDKLFEILIERNVPAGKQFVQYGKVVFQMNFCK